jgi:hypothetical protein
MAKESERPDPFPNLPRRGIERQFADVSEPEIRKALAVALVVNDSPQRFEIVRKPVEEHVVRELPCDMKVEVIEAKNVMTKAELAQTVLAEAETKVRRGRPPKYPGRPWEAEGITRRTWERREREKKA